MWLFMIKIASSSEPVELNMELQAVHARVFLPVQVTVSSLYLPLGISINIEYVSTRLDQLPSPFIYMGDFNDYNVTWESVGTDSRTRRLTDLFNNVSPCLMMAAIHISVQILKLFLL